MRSPIYLFAAMTMLGAGVLSSAPSAMAASTAPVDFSSIAGPRPSPHPDPLPPAPPPKDKHPVQPPKPPAPKPPAPP